MINVNFQIAYYYITSLINISFEWRRNEKSFQSMWSVLKLPNS